MKLDGLELGQFYTAEYLKQTGLIYSASFDRLYKPVVRCDKSYSDQGVIKLDNDTSEVYEVVSRNNNIQPVGVEVSESQAGLQMIPAPGLGKQIVIVYVAMRTTSTSGTAYLTNGVDVAFPAYFTAMQNITVSEIEVPVGENLPVTLVSSQGSKPLYVGIEYYIRNA